VNVVKAEEGRNIIAIVGAGLEESDAPVVVAIGERRAVVVPLS